MSGKKKIKSIQIDLETAERLDNMGTRASTYDSLIRKLLDFWDQEHEGDS